MWRYGWIVLFFPCVAYSADETAIRSAIESGLRRLETAARNYTTNRSCFSCHHQAVPVFALAAASDKGFKIDGKILEEQFDYTLATFQPTLKETSEGRGIPGGNTMINYGLETLLTAGKPTEEVPAAMRKYLVLRQRSDGSWPAITSRPPTEGSKFTNAYFALKHLKGVKDAEATFKRGSDWVLEAEPDTMEDRVFHLRALKLIGASEERIEKAQQAIIPYQKENGSWPQLKDMDGDAYATGTALVALRESGIPADHPAIRKGIDFLVKTQDASSGAWLVKTRSRPVQTYFDNGDPGGKSQFITIAATGWSVLALLDAIEK